MRILGISAIYHDSAACLLVAGRIVAEQQNPRLKLDYRDSFELD